MEEKITEIMFNHSRPNSTIGGRQYITENQYPYTAKEITAHVKEFVMWLDDECDFDFAYKSWLTNIEK